MRQILLGNRKSVLASTASKILSVSLEDVPPPAPRRTVDAVGFVRRAQALACMGWGYSSYCDRVGCTQAQFAQILYLKNRVSRERHVRMQQVYAELSMRQGPSKAAATKARNKGWAGPLAWDEGTIDDPTAEPAGVDVSTTTSVVDEVAVARFVNGEQLSLTREEKAEAARKMLRRGVSRNAIGERLGLSWVGVRRALGEAA